MRVGFEIFERNRGQLLTVWEDERVGDVSSRRCEEGHLYSGRLPYGMKYGLRETGEADAAGREAGRQVRVV